MEKRFLSPRELAAVIGVTPDTVLDWIHRGILKPLRFSKRTLRFDLDEVLQSLRRRDNETGRTTQTIASETMPVDPQ